MSERENDLDTEEIRRRAYERYEARRDGGTTGDEVDDWCCAEREVRERRAGASGAADSSAGDFSAGDSDAAAAGASTGSSTATGPDGERARAPRGHRADDVRLARDADGADARG